MRFTLAIVLTLILFSCNNGPKIIESTVGESETAAGSTGIFDNSPSSSPKNEMGGGSMAPASSEVHQAKVVEVLPTEKYVYLNVEEDGSKYWIATGKQDVKEGEMVFFKNGILKKNFESKEYNRIFETVYLVSNIVKANHGNAMSGTPQTSNEPEKSVKEKMEFVEVSGSISIAEIVNSPEKYKGKEVQVTGVCTKVNPNIMGRNWIHLKDGSKDDYDFVVTSSLMVPEGHTVTLVGTINTNLDFGAGYKYDILMENAKTINN